MGETFYQATQDAAGSTNGSGAPCVAILLSTFNGERYLDQQLASLTAQTHTNWKLYWRDDGSSDRTAALMAAFTDGAGQGRVTAGPASDRMRATGSFLTLLRMAIRGSADFFAFADQDDVWLPDKLTHGIARLAGVPADQPALYFCARTLVDEGLHPIGRVLAPRRAPGFPAALTQNVAPGCCMMLNRAAAEAIDACMVPDGTWHDWWAYVVVAANAGQVIADNTADILYRQHANNLIGEPPEFFTRTIAAVRRGRRPFMTLFWCQIAALQACPTPLPDRTRGLLTVIARAQRGSLAARLRALCIPGFVRQTWAETMLFRLWFLLN